LGLRLYRSATKRIIAPSSSHIAGVGWSLSFAARYALE
jgi:hypothetical protein